MSAKEEVIFINGPMDGDERAFDEPLKETISCNCINNQGHKIEWPGHYQLATGQGVYYWVVDEEE